MVGRYILPFEIFKYLEVVPKGSEGEIQLTDAIAQLIHSCSISAYNFQGTRYDCGNKLGFLTANFDLAKKDKNLGKKFIEHVQEKLRKKKYYSTIKKS